MLSKFYITLILSKTHSLKNTVTKLSLHSMKGLKVLLLSLLNSIIYYY